MLWMFKRAGGKNSNNTKYQFWQQNNHPIELYNNAIRSQKLDYMHNNPIKAGFVDKAEDYIYSSVRIYSGEKGFVEINLIE